MRRLMYSSGTSVWGSHADELGGARVWLKDGPPTFTWGSLAMPHAMLGLGQSDSERWRVIWASSSLQIINQARLGVKGGAIFGF